MLFDFTNNVAIFERSVDEHFNLFDHDCKGVLSREKLQNRAGKYATKEYDLQSRDEIRKVYDMLFEKFDVDRNGVIDRKEFRELMKEMMLAKARAIGNLHVPVIVQEDSLLMKAVKYHEKN